MWGMPMKCRCSHFRNEDTEVQKVKPLAQVELDPAGMSPPALFPYPPTVPSSVHSIFTPILIPAHLQQAKEDELIH